MRAVLLLLPVLVAGCDPKRSSPAAPAATTDPLVLAPKDDPDAELRQREEARIEGLRNEFRALPKADQVFVAMMNNKLRRRPAERLTEPEAEGLRRLGTYISEVTRRDYRVALADAAGADRLVVLLKLEREDSLQMRLRFASESRLDQLALVQAIEAAARGRSMLRESDRAFLKARGYEAYLKNLPE